MTEIKAQLLTDLPYHRIEQPRKQNKYLQFFGAYVALPLMTVILVASLLILFLLVKTYFSNSYIYAMQDKLGKNSENIDIGQIVDDRYNQFHSTKSPVPQLALRLKREAGSLLERAIKSHSAKP